jgi:hypothetical protein
MRRTTLALAAFTLACGCKEAPTGKPAAQVSSQPASVTASTPASTPASAAASAAPAGRTAPPTSVAWSTIFPKTGAARPAALAALRFGQPKAEVMAALGARLKSDGTVVDPSLGGIPTQLGFHAKRDTLRYIQLTLPVDAPTALAAHWGPATQAKMARRTGHWWLEAGASVQAVVEARGDTRSLLTYWPLEPWQAQVGTRKGHFGYERADQPILGATAPQVLQQYAHLGARQTGPGRIDLYLLPHERRPRPTHVRLTLVDGVVTQQSLRLVFGADEAMRDAMAAGLVALYGKATQSDASKDVWVGPPSMTMRRSAAGGQWVLTLSR